MKDVPKHETQVEIYWHVEVKVNTICPLCLSTTLVDECLQDSWLITKKRALISFWFKREEMNFVRSNALLDIIMAFQITCIHFSSWHVEIHWHESRKYLSSPIQGFRLLLQALCHGALAVGAPVTLESTHVCHGTQTGSRQTYGTHASASTNNRSNMEQWVISDFRKVHCVCGHRKDGAGSKIWQWKLKLQTLVTQAKCDAQHDPFEQCVSCSCQLQRLLNW